MCPRKITGVFLKFWNTACNGLFKLLWSFSSVSACHCRDELLTVIPKNAFQLFVSFGKDLVDNISFLEEIHYFARYVLPCYTTNLRSTLILLIKWLIFDQTSMVKNCACILGTIFSLLSWIEVQLLSEQYGLRIKMWEQRYLIVLIGSFQDVLTDIRR